MSKKFGSVYQLGYIVRDVDEAVKHWAEVIGVGPFYIVPITFAKYNYLGVESSPELRVAFGYSGTVQIELIEQVNDAPSAYTAWLAENGPGLHHVAMLMDNYDEKIKQFVKEGLKISFEGETASPDGKGVRFTFYETALHNGAYVEAVDPKNINLEAFKFMQDAAANWDGKNPIGTFG